MTSTSRRTSATALANLFGLTESRIHQLVKQGMPREKRGRYDVVKCVRWYVRFLRNAVDSRKDSPASDGYAGEREARIREITATADLKELELAERRENLVALTDVQRVLADLLFTTTAQVMAIPPRLAPELVGETSRVMVQAKLERACKQALGLLAKSGKRQEGGKSA